MYGRTSSVVLAAVAALLLAAPASADSQAAGGRATATQPQVATMVGARAEPAWLRALRLRSEALNRQSGLGAWESSATRGTLADDPAWLRALRVRSEALNQYYKLGEVAPTS